MKKTKHWILIGLLLIVVATSFYFIGYKTAYDRLEDAEQTGGVWMEFYTGTVIDKLNESDGEDVDDIVVFETDDGNTEYITITDTTEIIGGDGIKIGDRLEVHCEYVHPSGYQPIITATIIEE